MLWGEGDIVLYCIVLYGIYQSATRMPRRIGFTKPQLMVMGYIHPPTTFPFPLHSPFPPLPSLRHHTRHLRRRQRLERRRDLLLPAHAGFPVDLGVRRPGLAAVEEDGAHDDLGAHGFLVVVDVRGAGGAVVAVDGVAWEGKGG